MDDNNQPCICGHGKDKHYEETFYFYPYCKMYDYCRCLSFKLDNLQFVEDLAKERNLI